MNLHQEGTPHGCPVLACSNPNFICVAAKSPKGSTQFVLSQQTTIQQFKEKLSKHFKCETRQLVLVFFGRILKDQSTLQQCGISNGMSVHTVIRSLKKDSEDFPQLSYKARTSSSAQTLPSSNPTLPAFNPCTPGSQVPPEMSPSSTDWQQMPTSEMIVQKVWRLILDNPEIQQLAQQFPAICHILNNMDIMRVILEKMREIMDLAKKPDMVQDLKNADPLLISVQSNTTSEDKPLIQFNSDVQEPGMNLDQNLLASNSYATLARNPCPEPTVGDSQGHHLGSCKCIASIPYCHRCTCFCTDNSGPSSSLPNLAPNPEAGLCNVGGIQTLIVNLCIAYTKRVMFSLMHNALLASKGTGVIWQDHVKQPTQHLSQQMQMPEMVAAMSNPKAIQAWVQMEQGLQTLMAEAPVLIPWFMMRLKGLCYLSAMAIDSALEEESAALK